MKNLTLVAMLIAIIGMTNASRMKQPCFFFLEGGNGFYNLERIYKKTDVSLNAEGVTGNIQLNLCHEFVPKNCNKDWNAIGYIIDGDNCTPLTLGNSTDTATAWTYKATNPVVQVKNLLKGVAGLVKDRFMGMAPHRKYNVQLKEGVQIEKFVDQQKDFGKKRGVQIEALNTNNDIKYDLNLMLNCDKNAKEVQGLSASLSGRVLTVTLNSDDACSFDVLSFWDQLGPFKWIAEVAIAVLALAMCLFGIKIYKPSLGLIGFFAGAGASYIFASMFLDISQKETWYLWVEIGICVTLGIVCCIIQVIFEKVGFFVGGGALGYVLGNVLYDLLIHKFDTPNAVWYYVTVIVLAVIMAIVAIWLHDSILIQSTSVVGAYASVKMIGMMTGSYPDETTVVQRIEAGEQDGMPWEVYVFISMMIVLSIVGIVLQCWLLSKYPNDKEKVEAKKNNEYYNMI